MANDVYSICRMCGKGLEERGGAEPLVEMFKPFSGEVLCVAHRKGRLKSCTTCTNVWRTCDVRTDGPRIGRPNG